MCDHPANLRASGSDGVLRGGRDLLAVLVEADADGRRTVAAADTRTNTDDVGVDRARDAVVDLEVQLGESVLCFGGVSMVNFHGWCVRKTGRGSPEYTDASERSRIAADSTMLRTVKRRTALSCVGAMAQSAEADMERLLKAD